MNTQDRSAIDTIVKSLESAWNAADGDAFAVPFAEDADFVNVRAEHHKGRAAIAAGHTGIFRAIYAGSTNHYTVGAARLLGADLALVHVLAALDCPSGPFTGRTNALFSMVLARNAGSWQIVAFHNTMQPPPGR